MSKIHSAMARKLYQGKKRKHIDEKIRLSQRQQVLEDFALLQSKQSALNDIMDSYGCGHRNASSWKDPTIEEQKRLSVTRIVAKKRFTEAYTNLLITRARSLREAEMRRDLREAARAAERARAAAIAALPPPSRDPLDPHFNPNGGPCARCLSGSHKERHLVADTNQVPLESGNWGREKAREAENGVRVLGGKVWLEKGHCRLNVCCTEPWCAAAVTKEDTFTTSVEENEYTGPVHPHAIRLAAETAVKSRIHAQLALKRTHAVREYGLLMQRLETVPVDGVEVGQNVHLYEMPSLERLSQISPDTGPMKSVQLDAHCTAPIHLSSDLEAPGPDDNANSLASSLPHCHSSIAHPRSSPPPTSDGSQTLVFHKRLPVLSQISVAKTVCPSDSSEQTGLHSTGIGAPNTFKPFEVLPIENKVLASESHGIPGMVNCRPFSTVSNEITSFDRIKMELEYEFSFLSEVEYIDEAIRELRGSFNNGIPPKQSAKDTEVNLTEICPSSTSNLAASYLQSPLKIIELVDRPETAVVKKDGAPYHVKKSPYCSVNDRIGMDTVRTKWQMVGTKVDKSEGNAISTSPSSLDVQSTKKSKEKQSLGDATPIVSLSCTPVPCASTKTSASVAAKPGTGARSFPATESLQQRVRGLIARQTECVRARNAGVRTSACAMLERPLHRFISLAYEGDADLQGLSVLAGTRVSSSVKLSPHLSEETSLILSTPSLSSCQSWAQPMISPVSDLFPGLQRLSPPSSPLPSPSSCYTTSSSFTEAGRVAISSKIGPTSARLLALKEADDDVDLSTETTGDLVAGKRELLRSYLKQLLGNSCTKPEILPLNHSETYLSSILTSQIRPINALFSKSTEQTSPACNDQSNNNFRPQHTSSSHETLIPGVQECFEHRFGELNEISKPVSRSVPTSTSTLYAKEYSISHLNGSSSGVASSFTFSSRPIASSSSNLEISCDSSSCCPTNQFSVLSCHTLPISLTSNDARKSLNSPTSMRGNFAITKSASVALETPCQSSPVKHLPSHFNSVSLHAPDIAKECIIYDSSTVRQEGKVAAVETHSNTDLTHISTQDQLANKTVVENGLILGATSQPWSNESAVFSCASQAISTNSPNVPTFSTIPDATCEIASSSSFAKPTPTYPNSSPSSARNCIWFQKTKYSLQSIPTGLEDKMSPQVICNTSVPTDSTPNSSSRPSNQFSYLSSQSSCIPAEPAFVSEPEASQEPVSRKPKTQSTTSAGSATTTLHVLQNGLSIASGNGSDKSRAPPSTDVSVRMLNLVKGERHASASTLTNLRGGVVADEVSSPLCSDLSSILTTNSNVSPLCQSNDFLNGKKESSSSALLNNYSWRMKPPFKVRMLLHPPKSPPLELDTCSSTRLELQRVSRSVGTSPLSTLMCLQSDPIPPTPISCINKSINQLTRSNLTNPSKSLPIVDRIDDVEQIGTDSTTSGPPFENPTFYSLITYCNAAGGRITPSCNSNALLKPTDEKCGAELRNQTTETCCETCDSIDMSSSPSVSLYSFLENEAGVESSVEQKRNGEVIFSVGRTLTVPILPLDAPSPSGGVNQQTCRSSFSPPVPSRASLPSIRLEPLSMASILKESETVLQALSSADQKEGNEVATASVFAALPDGKLEWGECASSELFGSKASSTVVSPTISVGSKSANAKLSKMMSGDMKVDSVLSVIAHTHTGRENTVNAIVFDSVDGKVDGKEVGNTETMSAKSVGVNTVSEDLIGRKASGITAIVRKLVDARLVEVKPAIMELDSVEASNGSADTITANAKRTDAEPGVRESETPPTNVEIIGPKPLSSKAFNVAPVDATATPAVELSGMRKSNVEAAMETFISKSNAVQLVSVPLVGSSSDSMDSLSVQAGRREARPSGLTGVKMIWTKPVGEGAFAVNAVSAVNFDEKKVLTEFITAKLKEPVTTKLSFAKSDPLGLHLAVSAEAVSGPGSFAADSGGTKLTFMEVADIEQSVDGVVSRQPNRTDVYSAAALADLPTYLTTDTAATIARMRKMQEKLERKRSDPLPSPETRLLVGLQDELSVSASDSSSTQSLDREEESSAIQVMLSTLNRDQNERNSSSLRQKASHPRKSVSRRNRIRNGVVVARRRSVETP
ncbi:hypothetical protein TcWFU_006716 [Taenia crassiceps]|uniref:Uncharacterized protein n=1 Tax=Taenia crassiceps TaxID=6207 RepID=A0ABR4QRR6_9CEST